MRRIMIIGPGGAGKSTLARELGRLLAIKVTHLDSLFWRPGWLETPRPEWSALVERLCQEPAWVIDGNYGGTMAPRLQAADTVIFLDFPAYRCLFRVILRRWRYRGRSRPDMAPGCPEKLDWQFIRWITGYRRNRRPAILRQIGASAPAGGRIVLILRSPREVRRFLAGLAARSQSLDAL